MSSATGYMGEKYVQEFCPRFLGAYPLTSSIHGKGFLLAAIWNFRDIYLYIGGWGVGNLNGSCKCDSVLMEVWEYYWIMCANLAIWFKHKIQIMAHLYRIVLNMNSPNNIIGVGNLSCMWSWLKTCLGGWSGGWQTNIILFCARLPVAHSGIAWWFSWCTASSQYGGRQQRHNFTSLGLYYVQEYTWTVF